MKGWQKVYTSPNPIKAEFIKNELLSHEIVSVVLNKQDRSYLIGFCEVYVQETNTAIAKTVIDLLESNEEF